MSREHDATDTRHTAKQRSEPQRTAGSVDRYLDRLRYFCFSLCI